MHSAQAENSIYHSYSNEFPLRWQLQPHHVRISSQPVPFKEHTHFTRRKRGLRGGFPFPLQLHAEEKLPFLFILEILPPERQRHLDSSCPLSLPSKQHCLLQYSVLGCREKKGCLQHFWSHTPPLLPWKPDCSISPLSHSCSSLARCWAYVMCHGWEGPATSVLIIYHGNWGNSAWHLSASDTEGVCVVLVTHTCTCTQTHKVGSVENLTGMARQRYP